MNRVQKRPFIFGLVLAALIGIINGMAWADNLYENFSGTVLSTDLATSFYPTNPTRGIVTVENGSVRLFPGISETGNLPTGHYYRANIFTTNNSYTWHNAFPFSYEYKIKKWSRVPPSKTDGLRFVLIGNQDPIYSSAPESPATNALSITTSSNAVGLFLQWHTNGHYDCIFYIETNSPYNLFNSPNLITQQITSVADLAGYTIGLRFTNNTHGYFYNISPSGTETRTDIALTESQLDFFTNSIQIYLIGYNHLTNDSENAYYEIDYLRASRELPPPCLIDTHTMGPGYIDPGGSVVVSNGADAVFSLVADSGAYVSDILTNGSSIGITFDAAATNFTYIWSNVTANGTVETVFTTRTFVITASVESAHGVINPSGAVMVTYGQSALFSIQAAPYYHIAYIFTNESVADINFAQNDNQYDYVWSNVTENGSIKAFIDENLAAYGTPEWWLAQHGLTNTDFDTEALSDQDGDGHESWKEYVAGTIPTNAESVLQIVDMKSNNVVSWSSESNRLYTVMLGNDLLSNSMYLAIDLDATPPLNTYTNEGDSSSMGIYYIDVRKK